MEWILNVMLPMIPFGLVIMVCVAFGFALSAQEALGTERGLRMAAEKARTAAVRTLAANKDWELEELGRFRRLLDCHIDAIVAEATEFRGRPVPSPGGILESLCSWNVDWKRDLAKYAGLQTVEVDQLLKNDLPITPLLARKLETFTGAPARYWEYLYHLYAEYRVETDQTVVIRLGEAVQAREQLARVSLSAAGLTSAGAPKPQGAALPVGRRPVLELVDDAPVELEPAPMASVPSTAAEQPLYMPQASPGPRSSSPSSSGPSPVRRPAVELPSPVVPHPGLALPRERRGALPPPPTARLRSPLASKSGSASSPTRRAETLTDFPVQREGASHPSAADWNDIESSPLNGTLPGVGGSGTTA